MALVLFVQAACVDPVAELGAPKETSICVMAAAWDANSAATNAAAQISGLNSKVEITPMIGGEHRGKRCQYRGVPALGRSGGAFAQSTANITRLSMGSVGP